MIVEIVIMSMFFCFNNVATVFLLFYDVADYDCNDDDDDNDDNDGNMMLLMMKATIVMSLLFLFSN